MAEVRVGEGTPPLTRLNCTVRFGSVRFMSVNKEASYRKRLARPVQLMLESSQANPL